MVNRIDKEIIKVLESNSRLSFAEIGRKVNLSTSAVRERIIKLEDASVIESYSAKINYELIGFGIKAVILIKAHNGKLKVLSKKIIEFTEVKEVLSIMGEYNLHVIAFFKDTQHMQNFLDLLLPYGDTVTMITTKIPSERLK